MTVCVGVKVHDCIVFAADSATTLAEMQAGGEPRIVNIYENANKVFNLYKRLPVCAMTAGIGNFGRSSIATLSKDLRKRLMEGPADWVLDHQRYSIEEIARKARRFFYEEKYAACDPKPLGVFEYWIGGYSAGADLGEIWKIRIQDDQCEEPFCEARQEESTITWGGQPEAINRLLLGYGTALPGALVDIGLDPSQLDAVMRIIGRKTQARVLADAMPIIDAIQLARYLVDTTRKFVQFLPGDNTVGGEIDIAAVTKHEGFKWISRKHFYEASLNPLETDHV